ncbi:MAG: MarR family transcriptional regulator [Proteobacteria bacterium]|nr:MarR family transcriptional regulator [Pseudomonadota bacterium]MCH8977379.1 MarR family transcriptional regulator [Pseudomonadota bacterium]
MCTINNLTLCQLCFALYVATYAIVRAYRPRLGKVGLTYPQYLVLLVLWETDGMTVKGLAHRLKLDSGTLTPLLKRLESAGLMARRRSLEDERIVNIFLTSEEGQTLEHEVAQMQYEVACQTELLPTEFVELRDTLCRLIETMTESQQAATAIA